MSAPHLERLFGEAVAHHQAGRLPEAEADYRQVLAAMPYHVGALGLLGLLALQAGHPAPALELVDEAIRYAPDHADWHSYRGRTLKALGRMNEAVDSLQTATRLGPDVAGLQLNLGNALREANRLADAESAYRRAIALDPGYVDAHNNLGHTLAALSRHEEAVESFRMAVSLQPDVAQLHYNLGGALHLTVGPAAAVASFREAARLAPDVAEHHHALALSLGLSEQGEASVEAYQTALRLSPAEAIWHNELGILLMDFGRFAEAEAHFVIVLRLAPGLPDPLHHLGMCMAVVRRDAQAMMCYNEALRLDPGHARARYARAVLDMVNGRLAAGWDGYESRFEAWLGALPVAVKAPTWQGETMEGGIVLLQAEQGLGDTIQFCRYVPLVAAKARVVLVVQEPLLSLMSTLAGGAELVASGAEWPHHDRHCHLLSLPRLFATTLGTIPAAVPYLSADPAHIATWQARLVGCPGLRVGVVWAGNSGHIHDRRRSIPAALFDRLGGIAGVTFVSLQKDAVGRPMLIDHDWTDELKDFSDTAALLCALDLVISVDTSVAHLAGALGRPVWMLNRLDTDWRWLSEGADSPWYPTMRLFRQQRWGEWDDVLTAVRSALIDLVETVGA